MRRVAFLAVMLTMSFTQAQAASACVKPYWLLQLPPAHPKIDQSVPLDTANEGRSRTTFASVEKGDAVLTAAASGNAATGGLTSSASKAASEDSPGEAGSGVGIGSTFVASGSGTSTVFSRPGRLLGRDGRSIECGAAFFSDSYPDIWTRLYGL